ncbi:endonuclease domain-containing 1 protein-like [Huso huso]|uniref:Endonuclease domain-containing 1 protein-like n=1 Tax=Huso huso TaxID=61971 RepID=A0ABR0YZ12_HUSHU
MGFVCGVFLLLTLPALARSEVVNDFKVCKDFFLEGTAPTVQLDQNRYKRICQKYKNQYEFATLYDTTNRIPVYSAYRYGGCDEGERKKNISWAIEPQVSFEVQNAGEIQALDSDYRTIKIPTHLTDTTEATCFLCAMQSHSPLRTNLHLTNIVPQNVEFNGVDWAITEMFVRENIRNECTLDNNNKAYIVTGAVPSKNSKVNKRVNIPEYMWTAFCCKKDNRWVSMAHYGRNAKGEVTVRMSLKELEEKLKIGYDVKSFLVFGGNCYEVKATYFDYAMRFFRYLYNIIRG